MSRASAVPVLMYHHVSPNPGLVTVSPDTFAAQMEYLATRGYTTLSAEVFAAFLRGECEVPEKSVLITFDDGYLDNYVHAYPILQKFSLHAVLFVVTGWIGEGPARPHAGMQARPPDCPDHRGCMSEIEADRKDKVMLRWSEIEIMQQAGAFEFHSHTHSHVRWDKEYADPEQRIAALGTDLLDSRATLARRLDSDRPQLCWPWGYYEPAYVDAALAAGFNTLYSVAKGVSKRGTSPLAIPRIVVKDKPMNWFARRLWIYSHPLLAALYTRLRGD